MSSNSSKRVERVSRLGDPDIIAAANYFRKKSGMKPVKSLSVTDDVSALKEIVLKQALEIKQLKREVEINEREVKAEIERAKVFLQCLNMIKDESLRIAVTILVYWDNWGFLPATVFARLKDSSEEFQKIFEVISNGDNIVHVDKWVNTDQLKGALTFFGYGKDGSVFRGDAKMAVLASTAKKSKSKKSKAKKAKKEVK